VTDDLAKLVDQPSKFLLHRVHGLKQLRRLIAALVANVGVQVT